MNGTKQRNLTDVHNPQMLNSSYVVHGRTAELKIKVSNSQRGLEVSLVEIRCNLCLNRKAEREPDAYIFKPHRD